MRSSLKNPLNQFVIKLFIAFVDLDYTLAAVDLLYWMLAKNIWIVLFYQKG
jgi:hypothetical protein